MVEKALELLFASKETNYKIAQETGITAATLGNYRNGNTKPTKVNALALIQYFTNSLLTGTGAMLKPTDRDGVPDPEKITATDTQKPLREAGKSDPTGIPLVDVQAVAGFGNADFAIQECDVKEHYNVPKFKDKQVDFMIEVSGSSMQPKYNSGDVVACTILRESRFIQWGKVHVIATIEQGLLIKRLYPCDSGDRECIKCISDNEKYLSFEVLHNEITGIALVVGVIRLE